MRPLRIVHLKRIDSESWALLPDALERVRRFSERYENEPTDFGGRLIEEDPRFIVCLFLDADQVVGHILCCLDEWCGERYVSVLQYEIDEGGGANPRTAAANLREFERWAISIGCAGFQAITRNKTLDRVFRTHYGFKESYPVLRKAFAPLDPTGDDCERN